MQITIEESDAFIEVVVVIGVAEGSQYAGQKAAGAARKSAKGKVYRVGTKRTFNNGTETRTYRYARGLTHEQLRAKKASQQTFEVARSSHINSQGE